MPKNHPNDHFVPRTYLSRFTRDGGHHLFVYNKALDELRPGESIKNVASEWDFSTLPEELVGAGNGRRLEAELQEIDRQFAPDRDALVRLAETGGEIGDCLKISLANFLGTQFYRTRYFRELLRGAMEETIGRGEFHNPGEPWFQDGRVAPDLASYLHARTILEHSHRIAEVLYSTEWLLGINETPMPFFTSDAPVVRVPPPRGADPTGRDWWYAFPITPKLILRMFPPSAGHDTPETRERVITNENHVSHYNWVQIDQCHLNVFSPVDNAEFCRRFCAAHPTVRDPHRPAQQGIGLMNADWVREIGDRLKAEGD